MHHQFLLLKVLLFEVFQGSFYFGKIQEFPLMQPVILSAAQNIGFGSKRQRPGNGENVLFEAHSL